MCLFHTSCTQPEKTPNEYKIFNVMISLSLPLFSLLSLSLSWLKYDSMVWKKIVMINKKQKQNAKKPHILHSLTSEQYSHFCSRRSGWDWPPGAQTRPHTEYTGWSRSPSHSSSCCPASPPDDCQNEIILLTLIEASPLFALMYKVLWTAKWNNLLSVVKYNIVPGE